MSKMLFVAILLGVLWLIGLALGATVLRLSPWWHIVLVVAVVALLADALSRGRGSRY